MFGWSPTERLLEAAQVGNLDEVKRLIETATLFRERVDVNAGLKQGVTPLFLAINNGQTAVKDYLMQYDEAVKAAMELALEREALSLLKQLVNEHTIDLIYDPDRERILHKAVRKNNFEAVKYLVSKGANVYDLCRLPNSKKDCTALELAEMLYGDEKHNRIVSYLRDKVKKETKQVQQAIKRRLGPQTDTVKISSKEEKPKSNQARLKSQQSAQPKPQSEQVLVQKAMKLWKRYQSNTDEAKKLVIVRQLYDIMKSCSYKKSKELYDEFAPNVNKVVQNKMKEIVRELRTERI